MFAALHTFILRSGVTGWRATRSFRGWSRSSRGEEWPPGSTSVWSGDCVPPEVQRLTGKQIMREIYVPFVETLATGGQTLLHGDAHIGNTYVLPDDGVGFLDWQVVRRGNPAIDLGYFLQGACTVEDRRAAEQELVEEYRLALELGTDELPSSEDVWLRYRASTAHGLALWLVTAASDWQRLEVSLELSERYAAAFVDLDAAAAIDELSSRA